MLVGFGWGVFPLNERVVIAEFDMLAIEEIKQATNPKKSTVTSGNFE